MNAIVPLTQLGRYQIVKVLGRGAMGVVYEGLDPRLARPVAIKTILKSHLLDQTLAQEYSSRFVREAQAAARLNHPNIVTVFDFGEQDDIAYLVMEFIRGRELTSAFEAGERFALPDALRIMGELLDALGYAHAQGVVHRDVKPANVMIDATGRVKLTDFGVARLTEAGQDRTTPGTMVGTPSYMSPEQIQGLAVGSRTDLFAAGIILYQFLTGQRPFAGGGPFAIQKQIVQDDPVPPSERNPGLPVSFDRVVRRALAKAPENRYETAASFAAELHAAMAPASASMAAARTAPVPPAVVVSGPRQDDQATIVRPVRPTVSRAPRRGRQLALGGAAAVAGVGLLAWFVGLREPPASGVVAAPVSTPAATPVVTPAVAPAAAPPVVVAPVVTRPDANGSATVHDTTPAAAAPQGAHSPNLPGTKQATSTQAAPRTVAPSKSRADPRCADLRERVQLGEPLPPDQQSFFAKECR